MEKSRVLFADPLPSFNWWAVSVGGQELKWRQLAYHQLMSQLVHTVKLKPRIKEKISGRTVSSGTGDVVTASVLLRENPSEELLDFDNYYE